MTEVSSVANTVLTTLDIGSGIDSTKLAQDLTDAVKLPQQQNIQGQIDASEASISAYGLVKFQVQTLKNSFEKLNDANELATGTGVSSDISKITISDVAGSAVAGSYDFTVSQLAQNQRVISDQYLTKTHSLNSGSAFDISLAVGTTKSAVSAIYNATATAAETTTLVVGDGVTTVSIASASYNSIEDQVTAIQGGANYDSLLFTVHENAEGNGIEFRYRAAGSVVSAPTFTGTGSSHTITNSTVGVSVSTPVTGVAAEYNASGTAAETTTLVLGDGVNSLSVASASYTSIAQQVTAIQGAAGYANLKFTVAANSDNTGFKFTYKTTGTVTTAPTLTGSGSSHSISNITPGVTAVNAATTTTISVTTDTPAGIVSAINDANTGVTATLVDTGTGSNNYRIILAGESGSNGIFTLTSTPDIGFHDVANSLQSAQDAIIEYDGLRITRSSNIVSDVIEGVTFNLNSISASNVSLNITNDRTTLKTNIQDMVTTYNDLLGLLDNFTAIDSDADMAGSLSEDGSLVRALRDKLRSLVFGESSTPSGSITALRDIGVSVDKSGTIIFTEADYDAVVTNSYDNIVTMLTADTNNQNLFETASKGLAQDVASALDDLIDSTGVVTLREASAKTELTNLQEEMTKLEDRMLGVYNRYLLQFGAMESLMAQLDNTKDYLTNQFEAMSKVYDIK
jgi:flagellar hook-associated protein 2